MDSLPNNLIGKICSLTDDETIYNFGCSSQLNNQVINNNKKDIIFHRDNELNYELNVLKQAIPEFSIVPYNIHNFENLNIVSQYIGENIGYIKHKFHVSSPNTKQCYTTYYVNSDLLANDLMTSVKVKGDIQKLSVEFTAPRSFIDNMTDGFMNILPTDEQGYKEILKHFLPYIYFKLFPFSEIILRIQHIGDIDIDMTYVNFSKHIDDIIGNLTYRRSNIVFTSAIIPEMLYSNLNFDTKSEHLLFEINPSFISKGFVFIVKQNNKVINNPHEVIKTINIDLYDKISPQIITHSYIFNSRRLYGDKIKKSKFYNLNFQLNNDCLYLPLENINFNHVSKTIVKISFYGINTDYDNTGFIDIVYFSKNMIMSKDGFGSRYYW